MLWSISTLPTNTDVNVNEFTVNDDDDDDNDDDDDDDGSDSYGDNFTCRKHFLLYLCHLIFLILTLGVLSF